MAQENIAGLFGPTVEQIQQAQLAQDQAQALQIAQLSPQQALSYHGSVAGSGFGRALNTLGNQFGITREDPALDDAKVMKQVVDDVRSAGVDVNDPAKFYRQVADKLSSAGKTGQAMMLSMKAGEYEFLKQKRAAEVGKLDAERLKALREKESQIATMQREAEAAIREGRLGDAAQLETQIEKLNSSDKSLIETEEGAGMTTVEGRQVPQVRKVLIDPKTRQPVWQGTPFVKGTGQTVNVNNIPPSDDVGLKALQATWERQTNEFNKAFDAANQIRQPIEDMQKLIKDPKIIQGSLPEIRLEIVRAMNTLGFGDVDSLNKQNDSDLFDAYARNVILPKMRMLGGSDSNEELRKVEQSYANRKMDIAAIRRLVNASEKDIKRLDRINKAYDDGLAEGRNPIAFNWGNGSWRNIKGLPNMLETPPGVRPVPGGQGATAPVSIPTPEVAPPQPRQVTPAMVQRYREVFKDNPAVQRASDEAIKALLGK